VEAKASAVLYATMIYKQCVEQKQVAVEASADLSATRTCRQLAVPRQDNKYSFKSETKNETTQKTRTHFYRTLASYMHAPRLVRAVEQLSE
jgi:hypothetical protein